jgi:hypothetical protein
LNILYALIVIGIALLARSIYVAQKIKKDPETKKYGNNPKVAIGTLAIIGAVLFAVGCIGLPIADFLKPESPDAWETTENTTARIISTDEYTVKNQEQVIAFIQQLFSDRPVMRNYISDIEFIRPTLIDLGEYDYTFEDYGWKKEIYIEIKLKDKTSLPREWRADGQTLHFIIGSGTSPGVIAKKDVSQLFADMPVESGDSFVSLPDMIGIDDIGL